MWVTVKLNDRWFIMVFSLLLCMVEIFHNKRFLKAYNK